MKNYVFWFCLLSTLLVWGAEYKVDPAGKIQIDGVLDETCWQSATSAGNFTLLKSSGKSAAKLKTEFKTLADQENLYLAITCYDTRAIKADLTGPHANPWKNDLVEIFLSPSGIGDEFYQFVISAGGAYWQQFYAERGNIRPDPYTPVYDFSCKQIPGAWIVEVRFPFSALYMTSASAWKNTWLANVVRYSPGEVTENSTWSSLSNNNHETDSFNKFTTLPGKPLATDLRVNSAVFKTKDTSPQGFSGTMDTEIILNAAPAGEYILETCGQTFKTHMKSGSNIFSSTVLLPQSGRNQVKFTLKDAAGKVVHERFYPVLVDASPLKLTFTAPQYGGNFYPGEDASRLKGFVQVNIPMTEITLEVAGAKHVLPVAGGKALFDVDISRVSGNIEVKTGDIAVTVMHVRDAKAWIRNGRVIVNGTPTYLLGWYGGPGWICSKAFNEKYPSQSAKHPFNFPGWIGLEIARLVGWQIEAEEMVYDREPSIEVLDAIKEAVEKQRNSPHFVYYLSDEPECRGLSPVYLRYLYEYVKTLDPTRLVMIISREPVRYIDCADIINPHPYIGPTVNEKGERLLNTSIANVRDMCAGVERLQRRDKVLMLTPQTFCYSFNNFYAEYPTFDETNASIWASVCYGGQGITPYIWYDHAARPELSLGCDFIYTSLDRLSNMILTENSVRLQENDIRYFKSGSDSLYVLVNVEQVSRKFQFPASENKLYRFRDVGPAVVPTGGQVELELAPYQVVILTSREMDSGLQTLADLRRRIAQAEEARRQRGNILFGRGREIELSSPPSRPYDLQKAMEQQHKMFDGVLDVSAWMPRNIIGDSLWYEMAFTTFVPKFSKARLHGWNLQGLTFKIWKFGKWITPEAKRANDKYSLELDFGKTLSTVKVRLEFVPREAELYEFELIE